MTEQIEIELPNDKLLELLLMAHQQDKTFNQFVGDIIKDKFEDEYLDAVDDLYKAAYGFFWGTSSTDTMGQALSEFREAKKLRYPDGRKKFPRTT